MPVDQMDEEIIRAVAVLAASLSFVGLHSSAAEVIERAELLRKYVLRGEVPALAGDPRPMQPWPDR